MPDITWFLGGLALAFTIMLVVFGYLVFGRSEDPDGRENSR